VGDEPGVFVAASDYVRALPDSVSRWFPRRVHSLGTDGFGRSESREALREFFEVDWRFVTLATLAELFREKQIEAGVLRQAIRDLEIDPEKINPLIA
jgi:pyruvate dehydrogenase E1 component